MSPKHRNALRPGHRVAWYEIRKVLGQGGFGITYLALDTNLEQEVALKEYLPVELAVREDDDTVHPAGEAEEERFAWGKDRFIAEARTLAKFKHPNIVRVFSVFEASNTAYMVMEFEPGECLADRISGRRTMDEPEILAIARPVMSGLAYIHEQGFIHRDIKPANLLLRADGSPVLLDFGSARQAMGNQTHTLTALVSPGFAPFEQYHPDGAEQGPWTDIYGLGATLYRMATGVAPKDALDRSRALLYDAPDTFVATEDLVRDRFSGRFARAVNHALEFRASDRPQSIEAWRRDFEIDEDAPTVVATGTPTLIGDDDPTQVATRHLPDEAASPAVPSPAVPPTVSSRPAKTPWLVAGGLALVLMVGGATFWALSGGDPIEAPAPAPGQDRVEAPDEVVASVRETGQNAAAKPEAERNAQDAEAVDAERKRQEALAAEAERELQEALATEAERKQQEALAAEAERERQEALAAEAERKRQEALAAEAERKRQEALAAEAERKRQEALAAEAERKRQEALAAEAERKRQEALAAEAERKRQEALAAEAERKRQEVLAAEAERKRQEALAAEAERKRQEALTAEAERKRQEALAAEAERKRQEALAAEAERKRQEALAAEAAREAEQLAACRAARAAPVREPRRAGPAAGEYFAALAVGRNDGWGEASGYQSQAEAEQAALANCAGNDSGCRVEVWSNQCVALARGADEGVGWAWGATLREAHDKATRQCEAHAACCSVATAYCADQLDP